MPISLQQFEKGLSESGLLTADEVRNLRERLNPPPSDSQQFADALVQQKKLTKFQACRILDGQPEGLTFDEYVIVSKIGSGGMGDVFKARHRRMKRYVAVKAISPKAVDSPQAVQRFHREVEAASQLEHQNIVMALDAREHNGQHYLIMQYVDGKDLSTIVKERGPLTVEQAVDVTLQAAKGLEYAHEQGIIHRDIKPSNLLLDSKGTAKLLDMGLARIDQTNEDDDATAQLDLTNSGQVMGTADYMAPEQGLNTKNADERSDIYSLGCTLYRLLTGKPPYQGDTVVEKILAHTTKPIPSLGDARTDIPDELEAAYQKMMAKQPNDRQQTMEEVAEDLQAAVAVAVGGDSKLTDSFGTTEFISKPVDFPPSESELDTTSLHMVESIVQTPTASSSATKPKSKRAALIGGSVALALVLLGVLTLPLWFGRTDDSGQTALGQPADGSSDSGMTERNKQSAGIGSQTLHDAHSYALKLDGRTNIDIPTLDSWASPQVTIEVWVSAQQGVLFKWGQAEHYAVFLADPKDEGIVFKADKGEEEHWMRSPAGVLENTRHIALQYDGKGFELYLDGSKERRTNTSLPTVGEGFHIGGALGGTNNLHGTIEGFRVSSTCRYTEDFTPQETTASIETDEHTLALYHFDEGQGDRLIDSSGNNHHGIINGAKWVTVDDGGKGQYD